jgi:glycosyltransferase involved in cell wall biosynthesis
MNPTVSVTIAAYNYGRFLSAAVESVLAQTFGDFELIVVNDGSTDNTAEVILPYLADRRVRYYRTSHRGLGPAKNLGVRFARAPLVAFLDADDMWLPCKLERQMALYRSDPGVGVVYTRRLLIDEQSRQLRYEQPVLHRGRVLKEIFQRNFICYSSALVRRSALENAGMFDESLPLAIDYDLWLRVATAYRFDYVDEPLVKYRTGHANLSSRVEERYLTAHRIMSRFLNERGGRALLDPEVIRRAKAELFFQIGVARRSRSRWRALPWHIRALALAPTSSEFWRGLASLPLPERVRRWVRRALGRPLQWNVQVPIEEKHAEAAPSLGTNPCWQPGNVVETCLADAPSLVAASVTTPALSHFQNRR